MVLTHTFDGQGMPLNHDEAKWVKLTGSFRVVEQGTNYAIIGDGREPERKWFVVEMAGLHDHQAEMSADDERDRALDFAYERHFEDSEREMER